MKMFIIVFVAPENVCLGTKIESLSRMESEILIFICLYMAAILEIQDVSHIGANNSGNIRDGIIAFLALEHVCSGTKIESLGSFNAEILTCIGFYMAAILTIQDGCHNAS
jgi:hypothetical protein